MEGSTAYRQWGTADGNEATPMEIDALTKGKGKEKGMGKRKARAKRKAKQTAKTNQWKEHQTSRV